MIFNFSNYRLVLKIHSLILSEFHFVTYFWQSFNIAKAKGDCKPRLVFLNLYYNGRFYFISESWFHILCVFCGPDWKIVLFSQFLRIIYSLKHTCLMGLFTNWSAKLTLFFRANIFSSGIASLHIFSLILKDFIPYETMHFIVPNFTLTIAEGRFHEVNIIFLIHSVLWQQRSTFYLIYYWRNCWDCTNNVSFNFIRPILPDDSVNMKFQIGKLEPHCICHFIHIASFFNTCICSGFILTTFDFLFNCLLA